MSHDLPPGFEGYYGPGAAPHLRRYLGERFLPGEFFLGGEELEAGEQGEGNEDSFLETDEPFIAT